MIRWTEIGFCVIATVITASVCVSFPETFTVTTTVEQDQGIVQHSTLLEQPQAQVVQDICTQALQTLADTILRQQTQEILTKRDKMSPDDKEVVERLMQGVVVRPPRVPPVGR